MQKDLNIEKKDKQWRSEEQSHNAGTRVSMFFLDYVYQFLLFAFCADV
jgi:hypothetical protein